MCTCNPTVQSHPATAWLPVTKHDTQLHATWPLLQMASGAAPTADA